MYGYDYEAKQLQKRLKRIYLAIATVINANKYDYEFLEGTTEKGYIRYFLQELNFTHSELYVFSSVPHLFNFIIDRDLAFIEQFIKFTGETDILVEDKLLSDVYIKSFAVADDKLKWLEDNIVNNRVIVKHLSKGVK